VFVTEQKSLFLKFDSNVITRGHNLKLSQPVFKARCRKLFFSVRVCPVWNALPPDLVNCPSLNYFKSGLSTVPVLVKLVRFPKRKTLRETLRFIFRHTSILIPTHFLFIFWQTYKLIPTHFNIFLQ